jgi:uncharacterized protein (DUF1330 family)
MATIELKPGALDMVLQKIPADMPVTMLNLLRFRDTALYPDGESGISGRAAYARYSSEAIRHVSAIGGEVVMHADAVAALIAPADESWDAVLLVRYPSIEKFVAMVTNPDYQNIARHRSAALADSRLIATVANQHSS